LEGILQSTISISKIELKYDQLKEKVYPGTDKRYLPAHQRRVNR